MIRLTYDKDWLAYKVDKAVSLVQCGYSVEWRPNDDNWITAFVMDNATYGGPRLRACAKFFEEPSKYGIDEGRVSKLCIDELVTERNPDDWRVNCLYNYDRGLDVDRLDQNYKAKRLYEDILRILN